MYFDNYVLLFIIRKDPQKRVSTGPLKKSFLFMESVNYDRPIVCLTYFFF